MEKMIIGNFTLLNENNKFSCLPSFVENWTDAYDLDQVLASIEVDRLRTGLVSGGIHTYLNGKVDNKRYRVYQSRVGSRTLRIKRVG